MAIPCSSTRATRRTLLFGALAAGVAATAAPLQHPRAKGDFVAMNLAGQTIVGTLRMRDRENGGFHPPLDVGADGRARPQIQS